MILQNSKCGFLVLGRSTTSASIFRKLCSTTNASCQLWHPGAHATGMAVHILSTCSKNFPSKLRCYCRKTPMHLFVSTSCSFGADCCGHNCALPLAYSGFRWNALRYFKDGGQKNILKYSYRAKVLWAAASTNYYWQKKNRTCLEGEHSLKKKISKDTRIRSAYLQP